MTQFSFVLTNGFGLPAAAPHSMPRSRIADFLMAPFCDLDDRASHHAAAVEAERQRRRAATSGAAVPLPR